MQQKNIHWFPGHMQKALREIENKLQVVDVVIELLDARAPISSRNKELFELTKNKKRLIVLTKLDLSDKVITSEFAKKWENDGTRVISVSLKSEKAIEIIEKEVLFLGKDKHEKEKRRGMKPQPIRAMIIGIPNVGKSTLINRISHRKAASVQNTPGHTKAQQWIKVDKFFELLDTPGVLPPNYSDKKRAINLALIGSIKETILPLDELARHLLSYLNSFYPKSYTERFGIEGGEYEEVLNSIAKRRGLLKGATLDTDKAMVLFLKEFKDGLYGGVTLDRDDEDA